MLAQKKGANISFLESTGAEDDAETTLSTAIRPTTTTTTTTKATLVEQVGLATHCCTLPGCTFEQLKKYSRFIC